MGALKDNDLLAIIRANLVNSYGWESDQLTERRQKALNYFMLRQILSEEEFRSKFRSSDVFDTVTAILPPLLRIFLGGEKVGSFRPRGPEDVAMAEQATEYVEYIVTQRHNAFMLFYSAFLDALLCNIGIWKRYWDPTKRKEREKYDGLSDVGLAVLMADPDFKVLTMDTGPDGYIVEGIRTFSRGRIVIEVVPPEDYFISRSSKSIKPSESPFVAQRIRTTVSDLREDGFDVDPHELEYDRGWDPVSMARTPDGINLQDHSYIDETMRPVIVYECYIKVDWDGDGIAERRRIVYSGSTILINEESDDPPYSVISPFPIPHQPIGMSLADLLCPLQELHTSVTRQILDNFYQMTLGRWVVVEGRVNVDDLLEPTIPQIIRVTGGVDAVRPLPAEPVSPSAFSLLEYIQTIKENRTGVTRYNQGLDAQSLNKTATGITAILQQSAQKMEMVARCFAETGISDLYQAVLSLTIKHQRRKELVRLRNTWVEIDPTLWREPWDYVVNVGLGVSNKDVEMTKLTNLLAVQLQLAQGPPQFSAMISPIHIYNTISELVATLGYKDPSRFIGLPDLSSVIPQMQGGSNETQ
ncbi:MAG: hypothetical protein QXP01_00510 [Candidatus Hadarchaeum sp.]